MVRYQSLKTAFILIITVCVLLQNEGIAALEQATRPFDFTEVAKKSIPAVVSIRIKKTVNVHGLSFGESDNSHDDFGEDFFQRFFGIPREYEQQAIGHASGFIVSSEGYILTNSHVVKNASEVTVLLTDGREFKGKVIGFDPNTDVAVVKIDADHLPFLELGNSDDVEIGQWVSAVGNLLGLQGSLTVGVISAKGRNNLDILKNEDFIQTDATINKGNSGGPLLTLNSKVIGMNTAMITSTGGYVGIGFAIPSNILKLVLDQITKNGSMTRGFIGVNLQAIDNDLAQALGLKNNNGALIAEVVQGSPADRAGLKQGDVIQAFNKIPVSNVTALKNAISLMPPKSRILLNVLRKGSVMDITVETAEFPSDKRNMVQAAENGSTLGFEVQELTKEAAMKLGLDDDVQGVVISNVEPNSVAALAGLKKGAVILAVNQQNVSSVQQFHSLLESTPEDRPVLLLVKQGNGVRYISLRIDKK